MKMDYSTSYDKEVMARAQGVSLPVSVKQLREICHAIRGRSYAKAVRHLESVMKLERAIPYTRFNRGGTGHKPGVGPGRYPVKACGCVLEVLQSAKENAKQKGFNEAELVVRSAVAKQGPKTFHAGRKRGRKAKRSHVEIVVIQVKSVAVKDKETVGVGKK